jgi:hypothetical protein
MPVQADKPLVIYDHRVRWVAAINMAFFVVSIWFGLRFCSGFNRYILLAFCTAFCLFWIRDLVFGFRLKLLSDGRTLRWQEGKEVGSVPMAEIRKVLIGVRRPVKIGGSVLGWTYVRFLLRTGAEQPLPPSIAAGLRSRRWRHLKRLVSHIRTISNVLVEPIREPDLSTDGWEDEPGASNGGPTGPSGNSRVSGGPPSVS